MTSGHPDAVHNRGPAHHNGQHHKLAHTSPIGSSLTSDSYPQADVYPVMELPLLEHAPGGITAPSLGTDVDSAPIAFEPQADFGFGLWPPDPWEAILQDTLAPAFWDESTASEPQIPWNLATLLGSTPRTQESAERGGNGATSSPRGGAVGAALLQRVLAAWPVS